MRSITAKLALLLPVAGEVFLLTLPFIERAYRKSGNCEEVAAYYRRTRVARRGSLSKRDFNRWFFRCHNFRSVHNKWSLIGRPARLDDLSFADNFNLPSWGQSPCGPSSTDFGKP